MDLSKNLGYSQLLELAQANLSNPDQLRLVLLRMPKSKVKRENLLSRAASAGYLDSVNLLLGIQHSQASLLTAVQAAASQNQTKVLLAIMARLSPRAFNEGHIIPLASAAGNGHLDSVLILLKVTHSKSYISHALLKACENRHQHIIPFLIEKADVRDVFLRLVNAHQPGCADLLVNYPPLTEVKSWVEGKDLTSMPLLSALIQARGIEESLSTLEAPVRSRSRM